VLVGQLESAGFWLAVCGFNFLWNLSMPYLLATLAEFDHRGRIVVHGVSMQFVGYAIGPYVAAQLLTRGGFDLVNTAGATLFVVSALVILPGIIAQRQTATT
jgi:predicted MFS family arabinose efflux permease